MVLGSHLANRMLLIAQLGSIVESLDEICLDQVVPSVDLEISVDLGYLGFDLILVACHHELFSVVSIIIRGVHDVKNLANFSAISLLILKIVDNPSKIYNKIKEEIKAYLELFFGTDSMKCSQVSPLSPIFSITTDDLSSLGA